jgi:organic hydroperoxide reductase OsmC/OhrA
MSALPHSYEVTLSGDTSPYATLSTANIPSLRSAPPKNFDGPGDAWSPEHLLLAAVQSCFMFTFRAVAQASKLDFLALDVAGNGKVDRMGGNLKFTEIVLKARLTISGGADQNRARRILEKGKNGCLVTESLSVPVHLEVEIVVRP